MLDSVEKILNAALDNKHIRSILIRGSWGSGKTYLAQKVSKHQKPLYISLFGCKRAADITDKIIAEELGVKNDITKAIKEFFGTKNTVIRAASLLGTEFINQIIFKALPEGQLLILDDLERIDDQFQSLELFAFINMLITERHLKLILICNEEKCSNKFQEIFELLRNKIVDYEIVLNSSPKRSFEIAKAHFVSDLDQIFEESIWKKLQEAVSTAGITNIRVISQIFLYAEVFLKEFSSLKNIEQLHDKVCNNLVLLIGTRHRAISLITSVFVKEQREFSSEVEFLLSLSSYERYKRKNKTEEERELFSLLDHMEFKGGSFDLALEKWIQEHDSSDLSNVLIQELDYLGASAAWANVQKIQKSWSYASKQELLSVYEQINLNLLEPYQINILYTTLKKREDLSELAKHMLENWDSYFRLHSQPLSLQEEKFDPDIFKRVENSVIDEIFSSNEKLFNYLIYPNTVGFYVSDDIKNKIIRRIKVPNITRYIEQVDGDELYTLVNWIRNSKSSSPELYEMGILALAVVQNKGNERVARIIKNLGIEDAIKKSRNN